MIIDEKIKRQRCFIAFLLFLLQQEIKGFPLSTPETFDNAKISESIAMGDEEAFAELFYHYGPIINPVILKIVKNESVAEDVIAEVFLRLWLNRSRLPDIANLPGYIYRIATNIAFNELRSVKNGDKALKQIYLAVTNEIPTQEDTLIVRDLKMIVNKAIDALPAKRRKIYQLSREEGLSRTEIAEQLHISENTVKDQLRIALRFIQEAVIKDYGVYITLVILRYL